MIFFIGWHQPVNGESGCHRFPRTIVSVNRLLRRKSDFLVQDWILDSGAFTRITSGKGHLSSKKYLSHIIRWSRCGNLLAAVTQDYMCEAFVLDKTGLTVLQHQKATIARFDNLAKMLNGKSIYLIPVLQGYGVEDYLTHIKMYGDRLALNSWVGVGSVCKRNGSPSQIEAILLSIKLARPDLRLHGFGIKKTALKSGIVRDLLYSADSQAHSFRQIENDWEWKNRKFASANNPSSAIAYAEQIEHPKFQQLSIFQGVFQ